MILISCVDDRMGMLFDGRRQSQDRVLRERIVQFSSKSKLWMNHYSSKQFTENDAPHINISDDFISEATQGEFCFVEDLSVSEIEVSVEMIILYKWNRAYPFDLSFDIDLSNWSLVESKDFEGSSHEKITEEVYVRNA